MAHRVRRLCVLPPIVAVMFCLWHPLRAQTASDTREDRLAALQLILTDHPAEAVAADRRTCVTGHEPEARQKMRTFGVQGLPDASDSCAAVAARMARDGSLLLPYQELLVNLTGSGAGHDKLPAAMAATALKGGSNRMPVGNGKAAILTAAWLFDAGFTVAYQQRQAPPATMPALATLKPVAERCLAQLEPDLGLCYSTGYLYGVRAVNGTLMAALRQAAP